MAVPWVFLGLVLIHLVRSIQEKVDPTPLIYEPSWTYKCLPEVGCQRADHPYPHMTEKSETVARYESLGVCRTVCGRFGGLWPKPVVAALSTQTVKIHPKSIWFDLVDAPTETHALLLQMTRLVTDNLLAECRNNSTETSTPVVVYITINSNNLDLTWDTNEHYVLEVQTKDEKVIANVVAETVYGARHALESFTQLIASDKNEYALDIQSCNLLLITGAKIRDQPVYTHRGLVLDTSRNFIPMNKIRQMIDGMAATKMNVFHWHVTDSQSFPLESSRVPQFTRFGAYSSSEIYSTEEVRDLITFAQIRGVRVVIEIDSPAHAGNGWQWGKEYGLGDLAVCVNQQPWRSLCIQPPCGQLNPANHNMYRVLGNLYRDLAELLQEPALLHMGGDEVFLNCWNSSSEIKSYMRDNGMETNVEGFIKLWAEFHSKALEAWDAELKAAGRRGQQPVMIWSSELTQAHRIQRYLNLNRYVIEVWEPIGSQLLDQLLVMGYRTVSVPKDIWYLDHGFWGHTKYSNWRRMYGHRLPSAPNMLGGEVAMWSEYVDAQGLDTRVWPRAAAVAERLWSNPTTGASEAEPRLQRLRERLIARGLRPDVLSPGWCAQHDGRCL